MKRLAFKARFYETYYFALAVRNILDDRFVYLRELDEFYGDGNHLAFARPFPRYSAFHCFIEFVVERVIDSEIAGIDLEKMQTVFRNHASSPAALEALRPNSLPINEALRHHEIDHESFDEWSTRQDRLFVDATSDDVYDYYLNLQLQEPYGRPIEQVVREAFFILFQNRRLLLLFNEMIADQMEATDKEGVPAEDRKRFT